MSPSTSTTTTTSSSNPTGTTQQLSHLQSWLLSTSSFPEPPLDLEEDDNNDGPNNPSTVEALTKTLEDDTDADADEKEGGGGGGDDWESLWTSGRIEKEIKSSKTSRRIRGWGWVVRWVEDNNNRKTKGGKDGRALSESQITSLLRLLLPITPSYPDRKSKRAASTVLVSLLSPPGLLSSEDGDGEGEGLSLGVKKARDVTVKWLRKEKDAEEGKLEKGGGSSITTISTLLEWSCLTLASIVPPPSSSSSHPLPSPEIIQALIDCISVFLDSVLSSSENNISPLSPSSSSSSQPTLPTSTSTTTRTTRQRKALRESKSVNRLLLDRPDLTGIILDRIVNSSSSSIRYGCLLGRICEFGSGVKTEGEGEGGEGEGENNKSKQKTKGKGPRIVGEEVGKVKDKIEKWFVGNVVSSKNVVPGRVLESFIPALSSTPPLISHQAITPVLEKQLLRSPEVSLPLVLSLFSSYSPSESSSLSTHSIPKLLPHVLSAAKSSNSTTRSLSIKAVEAMFDIRNGRQQPGEKEIESISIPVKTGKTASPEHRTALLTMLSSLPPGSASTSSNLVDVACSVIAKENLELPMAAACQILSVHLLKSLNDDVLPSALGSLEPVLTKPQTKSGFKKPLMKALGEVFTQLPIRIDEPNAPPTSAAKGAFDKLGKALTVGLKTITGSGTTMASAINARDQWLETLVAIGIVGKTSSWSGMESLSKTVLSSWTSSKQKSFLFSERVYKRLDSDEELWILKAIEAILCLKDAGKEAEGPIGKDPEIGVAITQPIVHIAATSSSHFNRQQAAGLVLRLNGQHPRLAHLILRPGLRHWLIQEEAQPSLSSVSASTTPATKTSTTGKDNKDKEEEQTAFVDVEALTRPRLRMLVRNLGIFGESVDPTVREELLVPWVVLGHHPRLMGSDQSVWIEMLRSSQLDVALVVKNKLSELFSLITQEFTQSDAFSKAATAAVGVLALVQPDLVVPDLLSRIRSATTISELGWIRDEELGIWSTPEGTTFVDVLAAHKSKAQAAAKASKQKDIEKWENELRQSLAKKKAAPVTLSKAEQALVDAQLEKERVIRERIRAVLKRVEFGFLSIAAVASSNRPYIQQRLFEVIELLLDIAQTSICSFFSSTAFQTFVALSEVCKDRLGPFGLLLPIVILRQRDIPVVPENYLDEPLDSLTTRVLYRLRFLSEQLPFDSGSFSFVSPILEHVVVRPGEGEEGEERLTLAVDLLTYHAQACEDASFPRSAMMRTLIKILDNFLQLTRPAATALTDLTTAMKDNATIEEINILIHAAVTDSVSTRRAVLEALQPLDLTDLEYSPELWVGCHESDERNASLASDIWLENNLDVPESFLASLLPFLDHSSPAIRDAGARAIAEATARFPSSLNTVLDALIDGYREKNKPLLPEYDKFGMIIESSLNREDPWWSRKAQGTTLVYMASLLQKAEVMRVLSFFIDEEALGDRSGEVRSEMLLAGSTVVDAHSKLRLVPVFEKHLGSKAPATDASDKVTEGVIVLLGRAAGHLDPSDPTVHQITARLIKALAAPSELVQMAVADCLPRLVRTKTPKEARELMNDLLKGCLEGKTFAERRGSAYGLAGAVRGRGLLAMNEMDLVVQLKKVAEDKKSASIQARQGALGCLEVLSGTLGRLFEPYAIDVMSVLLTCLSDPSEGIKAAATDSARVIMSHLSGHATRLVLPTLLSGLDEKQWRTKRGAIDLLASMSFLAPRQLAISLPTIIPRLTKVLADTHKAVKESANVSLKQFGEVITNPEISALQPALLDALIDPAKKTPRALDALLQTSFGHYIDSPSLALVIPILDRGLRDKSADTKKKAAQIVGNMATLTDSKDLFPYLPQLLPLVRGVLVDPVPEARATASKCLGSLIDRLGEERLPELLPSLFQVLRSDATGVDQQGAAQGISEILAALGTQKLDEVLPQIIQSASSPRPYVREGHVSLLVFLPATFGDRFASYIAITIQPILNGLADDSDQVREASMRAAKTIVALHSSKAVDLLLPELERGLFDQSWRIRLSSIQLMGDLLFRISGISGAGEIEGDEEEDNVAAESTRKALVDALGKERHSRVLAALYVLRSDLIAVVRQASIHVWKALVSNTPRTIREILPVLIQLIVSTLASPGVEQRETAARTLGETCRKLGESRLGDVIGILRERMGSGGPSIRQGVCLALTELMENTTKGQVEAHEAALLETVRTALVDSDAGVRAAAAKAFDSAQTNIGPAAIDETIPTLLAALQQEGTSSEAALQALQEVLEVRATTIFPIILPSLVTQPITVQNAKALSGLVGVAGSALGKHLSMILSNLQVALAAETDDTAKEEITTALHSVLASVKERDAIFNLMMELLSMAKGPEPEKTIAGCDLFGKFCELGQADTSEYRGDWIRLLVSFFENDNPQVVESSWNALDIMTKKVPKDEMDALVVPLRRIIDSTGVPGENLPGFCRPAGLRPILPILLQGLLSGSADQREQAALALGDVVERTSEPSMKAFVVQMTGPLIRIVGDRFSPAIKAACLSTLAILLRRVATFVRPFFPQLQRSMLKNLSDQNLTVRTRASTGLAVLMASQPRVDPVIIELLGSIKGSGDDLDIQDSNVGALANVITSGGKNITAPNYDALVEYLQTQIREPQRESRYVALAQVFGSIASHKPDLLSPMISLQLRSPPSQPTSLCIRECIERAPDAYIKLDVAKDIISLATKSVASDQPSSVARPCRDAIANMKEVWGDYPELLQAL